MDPELLAQLRAMYLQNDARPGFGPHGQWEYMEARNPDRPTPEEAELLARRDALLIARQQMDAAPRTNLRGEDIFQQRPRPSQERFQAQAVYSDMIRAFSRKD